MPTRGDPLTDCRRAGCELADGLHWLHPTLSRAGEKVKRLELPGRRTNLLKTAAAFRISALRTDTPELFTVSISAMRHHSIGPALRASLNMNHWIRARALGGDGGALPQSRT